MTTDIKDGLTFDWCELVTVPGQDERGHGGRHAAAAGFVIKEFKCCSIPMTFVNMQFSKLGFSFILSSLNTGIIALTSLQQAYKAHGNAATYPYELKIDIFVF